MTAICSRSLNSTNVRQKASENAKYAMQRFLRKMGSLRVMAACLPSSGPNTCCMQLDRYDGTRVPSAGALGVCNAPALERHA